MLAASLAIAAAAAAGEQGNVELPEPRLDGDVSVEGALARRRSVREFAPEALSLSAVSQLLWAVQGITDPSGLRTAPSAGALYPLEIYLVAGRVTGLSTGVYHYEPRRHRLVPHQEGDARKSLADAALGQDWLAEAPAIIVITAVYERTASKYGKRSARYVHMEAGHAAQNVYLQAAALGLGTTVVGAYRDEVAGRILELPKHTLPLALLPVGKLR